jgi:DNA polymerase III delta prime subunit
MARGYHPDLYVPAMAPSGKEVALDVLDFLDGDGGPPCLLLVGAPGVGKTTALHRLEAHLTSDPNNKKVWIYFSGNAFSTEIGASRQFLLDALEATVATALKTIIGLTDEARNSFFRDIYDNDPELVKETLFQPKPDARQAREAVEAVLRKSPSHYLSVVLRYFVRSYGSNRVVLIV